MSLSTNLRPGRELEYVLKPGQVEVWNHDGAAVMGIHYGADPEKNAAWAAANSEGIPPSVWQREMEGRIRVFEGTPVHPEYNSGIHEVEAIGLPPVNRVGWLVGSWDAGKSLTPAFVLRHITPRPFQIQVIKEVVCPDDEGMHMGIFCPYVRAELDEWDRGWRAHKIEHWGDPSIEARDATNGKRAREVAEEHGFIIVASTNNPEERLDAVSWGLLDWIDEQTPRVVYSSTGCPTLTKGLAGGYMIGRQRVGDGTRVLTSPVKNKYSHPCDADQYGAIRAKQIVMGQASLAPVDTVIRGPRKGESRRYV